MSAANLVDREVVGRAVATGREPLPTLDDRFEARARLGRGGSGTTFTARDRLRGDECVVKVFEAASGQAAANEFRELVTLGHPSIVRVRDVGRAADGRVFIASELVAGGALESLAGILDDDERRRTFERAARELADALAYLHARGLAHGDVCPPNVRFDADGRAVLLDFGLAGPPRQGTGGARGTLGYAPPEALVGTRGAAGDLFGLAATLFEAWTGAAPFGRGLAAVQRMLTTRAPSLASVRSGLTPAWDALVASMLAPEVGARPASARQVLAAIARASVDAGERAEADLGVPYPAGDPLEGVFVGRGLEREAALAVLERLAEGAAPRAALVVVGAPGSGRRTLIEVVARELALGAAAGVSSPLVVVRGGLEALEALVGASPIAVDAEPDADRREQLRFAALADGLERFAVGRPVC
ncbi:MAG: serine/threonine protein kinase, partial [Myxococcales bacterium]|nr:serine/threonine protein kinase [Myxococcales bacterium]